MDDEGVRLWTKRISTNVKKIPQIAEAIELMPHATEGKDGGEEITFFKAPCGGGRWVGV